MKKTISIIIPTYNRARILERVLQQLLAQTQIPDEVIIVDDHSTDNTFAIVRKYANRNKEIQYILNSGRYQRDAKKTGLKKANSDYIGFLDDDVIIEDKDFFAKLQHHLKNTTVIQAKVILENMGKKNIFHESWFDHIAIRPYPVLELMAGNLNTGSRPRRIYPLIEFGNFFHTQYKEYFIDKNLIKDGYGESYLSSMKLYRFGIPLILIPELLIRHPGALQGGSNRFDKKNILQGFTDFHYGYFYNMIYIHARYFPWWIWLWLPFFAAKACIALAVNRNIKGFYAYGIKPIAYSFWRHIVLKQYES